MILCIETATGVCSVALISNEKIISFRENTDGFSHSEKLTVYISEIFTEAGINLNNLKAIAVSSGPGSYTGLRIGVSVAKGLCFAGDKPLISISTLEAMAFGAVSKLHLQDKSVLLCPMIDARRMEVYCALYDSNMNCIKPIEAKIITPDLYSDVTEFGEIFYFGDGAGKCQDILAKPFSYLPDLLPSSKNMAALATKKFLAREFENLALFEPFYLKAYNAGKKIN